MPFKSFKVEPFSMPFDDGTPRDYPDENMYKFNAQINDNLGVEGIFKHYPNDKLMIRGLNLTQKDYQGIDRYLTWDEAKGKLTTGNIRELIRNAGEQFPDVNRIRGLRSTGVRSKEDRPIFEGFQEFRIKK